MTLRFALIGSSGFAAEVCAPALAASPYELVGVLGSTRAKGLRLAAPLGARAYSSLDDLLADDSVDAIWLAADDRFHAPMGTACLAVGKHVLVEKPIAQSTDEARTLIDTAKAHGKVLHVGLHSRFRPVYNDIRAAIHAGRLGRVVAAQLEFFVSVPPDRVAMPWRARLRESGGGWVVKELAAHQLDLLLWWLGPADGISGARLSTVKQPVETDDSATILVPLESGATGIVVVSGAMPKPSHAVRIHGTEGSLEATGVWRGGGRLSFSDGERRDYTGESQRLQPYLAQLDDFAAAVAGRPAQGADGAAGLASFALSEQAIEWAGKRPR
jgi:predicted dehydrogenase